jgi:hypothetical protein
MNSRPIPLLLAAALALAALPAGAQEERKPDVPVPPRPPGGEEAPKEPGRPPGAAPGREGPREERRDGRFEPRRENPRGPEGMRRPEEGPKRDGDRRSGADSARERGWNMPLPPPAAPVPTPYLGVVTLPPPAALSAQLGLKEGFGLVVAEVLPDSPAAKAGVQKHDVLTKFNDQQLVDAGQFSTLVRGAGKDSEATLTLLREAKEQKVPVKVGERMAPPRQPFPGGMEWHGQFEKWKGPAEDGLRKMQERLKEYGEKMREYQERLKGWQKNPAADMPQPPPAPAFEPEHAALPINPADILVQAQPGGARQIRLFHPNGAVSYNTADVKMLMKDDNGEIEVSAKDGKRVLLAKNAKGETVFEGPVDTEEQRKALPEDIRKKIELIQVRASSSAAEAPVFLPAGDNIQ